MRGKLLYEVQFIKNSGNLASYKHGDYNKFALYKFKWFIEM